MIFAHLPGSYASMNLTRKIWQCGLNDSEQRLVYTVGIAGGILPDADALLTSLSEHRASITHTPFFWFLCCCGIAALALIFPCRRRLLASLSLAMFIGAMTHLLLDAIFVGIRLFYPLSTAYYRLLPPISLRYGNWIVNYVLHPMFLTEIYTSITAGIIFQTKRHGAGNCALPAILRVNQQLIGIGVLLGLVYAINWYIVYPLTH